MANEFAARLDEVRAVARRRRLDLLILVNEFNVLSLTGVRCDNGILVAGSSLHFYTDFRYTVMARRVAPWLDTRELWKAGDTAAGLRAAAALFTRKKMIKEIDGAVSGTVFFIFGSAAGEYGRWLEENGTVMEITTSVFGRGTFGAVKKNSKRYAVHISGVYPIIKRLSLKNDIKIIKIY